MENVREVNGIWELNILRYHGDRSRFAAEACLHDNERSMRMIATMLIFMRSLSI